MSFLLFSLLLHCLIISDRLSQAQDDNIVTPASYPTQVPGTCGPAGTTDVFDCGADNGGCIPFSNVRDCKNDCTNGADELCGTGLTLCDVNVLGDSYRCGKCIGALVATCKDRLYQFLCTPSLYKCNNTLNCVLDEWLVDQDNNCGDWSDETNDTTPTTTCTCPAGLFGDGRILGTGCSIRLTTTTALTTTTSTTTTTTTSTTSTTSSTTTPTTTTTTTTPATTSTTSATTTPATTTTTSTTTESPAATTTTSLPTTTTTTTPTTTTTTASLSECVDQFQCVRGGCLPDSKVRNGAFDCPTVNDTSDETYCETVLTSCPAAPSENQCVYSWSTHQFACGCAETLTMPGTNKICIPRNDLPENCADIVMKNPDAQSGVETLYNKSCYNPRRPPCNFAAFCDQDTSEGGWTVLLRRANGTTNFDRTFDEYAAGFGPMENDDFYMGNTLANLMTSSVPHELLVYGMFVHTNKSFMIFYSNFTVASQEEGFAMHFNKIKLIVGTTANDMLQSNNLNFSAKDAGPVTGCARTRKGGWWWTSTCNPSGGALTVPLEASQFDVNVKGVFWEEKQLTGVALMLRPVGYVPPPGKDDPPVGSDGSRSFALRALCASLLAVLLVL
uniref:Fibrinogen C-terminal domain-containing protein n=1 Tax=Plectus sambesii TaxID=2011161 RepID=A0A914XGN4_9BILA